MLPGFCPISAGNLARNAAADSQTLCLPQTSLGIFRLRSPPVKSAHVGFDRTLRCTFPSGWDDRTRGFLCGHARSYW